MEKAGRNDGTLEGSDEEDSSGSSGGEGNSSDENNGSGSSGGSYTTEDYIAYGNAMISAGNGLTLKVTNGWGTENGVGLQLELTVESMGGIEEMGWMREFSVKGTDADGRKVELSVSQIWNAQAEPEGSGSILLTPMEYNGTVPAGGSVSGIGMIVTISW